MIAIHCLFVVALTVCLNWRLVDFRRESVGAFVAFVCLTQVVGLRWTFDYSLISVTTAPIFGSLYSATAWYWFFFLKCSQRHAFRFFCIYCHLFCHLMLLLLIPLGDPPLDPCLDLLYVGYGSALILGVVPKASTHPEQVAYLIRTKLKAERLRVPMLLMSAMIDGALAVDFHFLLRLATKSSWPLVMAALPVLAIAVI